MRKKKGGREGEREDIRMCCLFQIHGSTKTVWYLDLAAERITIINPYHPTLLPIGKLSPIHHSRVQEKHGAAGPFRATVLLAS